MHLKSRNKVSTVKWQGEKNNQRRSEINTGKTSERNGWGAFFTSFCSFSSVTTEKLFTSYSGKVEIRSNFFFFFQSAVLCVLKILLLILIVSLSSSSPSSSSSFIVIIIIIIIITIFSSVHIFLAIYFLLD